MFAFVNLTTSVAAQQNVEHIHLSPQLQFTRVEIDVDTNPALAIEELLRNET